MNAPAHPQRPADPPNRAYYRSVEGRWSAPLDLAITDWRAFREAPMSLVDRLRLLSMVAATRLIGPARLETSVDASQADRGVVIHTTRVRKWGMTFMRSVEHITLGTDGQTVSMRIEMRLAPAPWRVRVEPAAPAMVDADGSRASYRFTWFGTAMRQEAERSADGNTVTLVQVTDFSRSVQILRRRTSS